MIFVIGVVFVAEVIVIKVVYNNIVMVLEFLMIFFFRYGSGCCFFLSIFYTVY